MKGNSKQQGPSPPSPGDPGFPNQQFLEPQRHLAYHRPQFRCSCSSLGGKVVGWSSCPRSAMVSPAAGPLPVRGWHVTPRLPESLGDQHSPALPRPAQSTPRQLRHPTVQGLSCLYLECTGLRGRSQAYIQSDFPGGKKQCASPTEKFPRDWRIFFLLLLFVGFLNKYLLRRSSQAGKRGEERGRGEG